MKELTDDQLMFRMEVLNKHKKRGTDIGDAIARVKSQMDKRRYMGMML